MGRLHFEALVLSCNRRGRKLCLFNRREVQKVGASASASASACVRACVRACVVRACVRACNYHQLLSSELRITVSFKT